MQLGIQAPVYVISLLEVAVEVNLAGLTELLGGGRVADSGGAMGVVAEREGLTSMAGCN